MAVVPTFIDERPAVPCTALVEARLLRIAASPPIRQSYASLARYLHVNFISMLALVM
jgi:hypothetical protein